MADFRRAWGPLFERHRCQLVTVWDGDEPRISADGAPWVNPDAIPALVDAREVLHDGFEWGDLFCRRTDAVRNVGFVLAAKLTGQFIYTLDDDCLPPAGSDPIQEHLDALANRVPLSWMNTAMPVTTVWDEKLNRSDYQGAWSGETIYLRGVPYGVRDEAPVMLSHGVWVNVPDFDGETQLALEAKGPLPYTLPYFRGPVPRGVLFACCGMSVMVRREALPYLYFAPMGADSGFPDLHRFADIFMGVHLKREFDRAGWACYTGASTVIHTRASDARKNFEQERLGRQWNEWIAGIFFETPEAKTPGYGSPDFWRYMAAYTAKRERYAALIRSLLGAS